MKKDNTILLILGLAAAGAGIYFYMKSKTPVRRGYTITVPEPTKITASQYYAQTQAPQGPSLLSTVLSLFKPKSTSSPAQYDESGARMNGINKEISNFF